MKIALSTAESPLKFTYILYNLAPPRVTQLEVELEIKMARILYEDL